MLHVSWWNRQKIEGKKTQKKVEEERRKNDLEDRGPSNEKQVSVCLSELSDNVYGGTMQRELTRIHDYAAPVVMNHVTCVLLLIIRESYVIL